MTCDEARKHKLPTVEASDEEQKRLVGGYGAPGLTTISQSRTAFSASVISLSVHCFSGSARGPAAGMRPVGRR